MYFLDKNVNFTTTREIIPAFVPKTVTFKTKQSLGRSSTLIVKVGDVVKECEMIASSSGFMSSNLHSPIPGTIVSITQIPEKEECLFEIQYEGAIESLNKKPDDLDMISDADVMQRVNWSGITDPFDNNVPLYCLLKLARINNIKNLYISTVEHNNISDIVSFYIENKIEQIGHGIAILEKLLKLSKITFTGPNSNNKRLKKIRNQKMKFKHLKRCPNIYYRKKLNAIINKTEKNFPHIWSITSNSLIVSVETLVLLYEAVLLKKPYTEKIITIYGKDILKPVNYKVKLGVSLLDLFEEININFNEYDVFVNHSNGLRMIDDIMSFSVEKATSAIILKSKHRTQYINSECNGCNRCIEVCPAEINPKIIYKSIIDNDKMMVSKLNINHCIECGLCNEVCPANIDILTKIKEAKL